MMQEKIIDNFLNELIETKDIYYIPITVYETPLLTPLKVRLRGTNDH